MAFLKFILITALVIWLLKEVFRLFLPYLLRKFAEKVNQSQNFEQQKKEGDTSVINSQTTKKESLDDIGEYVDYEEVNDK